MGGKGRGQRRIGWAVVGLGVLLGLVAVGLAYAPQAAPGVMTMGTMNERMGVSGYEDEGHCEFWMVDMSNPTQEIERSFSCGFAWDWSEYNDGTALVHEALYDHDKGGVFEAPDMQRGQMQEWYRVNGYMLTPDALQFQGAVEGEAGVLMPPPGAEEPLTMGWVESGAEKGATERLVVGRELVPVGGSTQHGIAWRHWESNVERVRTTWHGYDVYLSEEVTMLSDPKTAWILEMHRHVLIEMTPAQMAEAMEMPVEELPEEFWETGEPQAVMELDYDTLESKKRDHAEQAASFQRLMAPIENGSTWGLLLGALSLVVMGAGFVVVRRY